MTLANGNFCSGYKGIEFAGYLTHLCCKRGGQGIDGITFYIKLKSVGW